MRGSDRYWANTEAGVLFNLICLGEFANPMVLLDEMNKGCAGTTSREVNPLAQLHGALERETAQRLVDISVDSNSTRRSRRRAALKGGGNRPRSVAAAYSTPSRTPFRCDGGQHSAVMADTVPR